MQAFHQATAPLTESGVVFYQTAVPLGTPDRPPLAKAY